MSSCLTLIAFLICSAVGIISARYALSGVEKFFVNDLIDEKLYYRGMDVHPNLSLTQGMQHRDLAFRGPGYGQDLPIPRQEYGEQYA
jgi:hypothetical protein